MLSQACTTEGLPGGIPEPGMAGLVPVTDESGLLPGDKTDAKAEPADGAASPEMLLAMLSDAQPAGNPAMPDAAQTGAAAAAVAAALQNAAADGPTKLPVPGQATGDAALLPSGARPDARTPTPSGLMESAQRPAAAGAAAERQPPGSTAAETSGYAKLAAETLADRTAVSANAALAASTPAAAPGAMPLMTAPAAVRTEAPAPATISIGTPVGNPYFSEETAQHVSWLVGNGIEQARINVHPADLGPIEIRISVNNGEAVISFAVTQPATSAAIEDAMPRLREMLAESGISLGQTSVGSEGTGFGAAAGESAADRQLRLAAADPGDAADPADAVLLAAAQRVAARNGMVDLFA
jgi:flagellar hook-length control protein FliK